MALKDAVYSITHFKSHAADMVREVSRSGRPVLITQKGEARVVVMDAATYGRWRDAMAMLRIVAQGEADVAAGRTVPQREAFAQARRNLRRAPKGG
ncbi:MAG: type II toxin-antitoxin system Phd/YefM family antitoxin [Planctomycetes bacterium]|nr:type II toxin-antitoxin system Phd/YefM family antitoxin [Planctomycetota bacterium]